MNKTPSWLGKEFVVDIEKVAHGGVFVARHDGRVVFVSHVLPGEQAKVRVFEDRGGSFCRAEPIEIVEASPDRVKHFWKQAGPGGAGGAEFGHIKLSRQRELKADVLEEALKRMAGLELRPVVEALPGDDAANGLGYRTRVQLQVGEDGTPGPYRERSHDVVWVKDLPLAVEDIREAGIHLKNWSDVSKIEIASSSTGQLQWLVDKKIKGDERLVERAAGRTFRLSPGAFWQVHRHGADALGKAVVDLAAKQGFDVAANNLDLYGGAGLFSGALAAKFGTKLKITSVEQFKQATDDARMNLHDIDGATALCTPVERFINELKPDGMANATVVLDPPRSGAGAKVVAGLLRVQPKHIIYVACDPIALARDLKQLTEGGYKLAELKCFDLFPHTHHFESIASLVRA